MALNAKLWTMALNVKLWVTASNAILGRDGVSKSLKCGESVFERHTEDMMVALKAKLRGNDEGKNVPVWCIVTTLDPLKGSKRDSMSLKRCSIDELEWLNQL